VGWERGAVEEGAWPGIVYFGNEKL